MKSEGRRAERDRCAGTITPSEKGRKMPRGWAKQLIHGMKVAYVWRKMSKEWQDQYFPMPEDE